MMSYACTTMSFADAVMSLFCLCGDVVTIVKLVNLSSSVTTLIPLASSAIAGMHGTSYGLHVLNALTYDVYM